MGTEIKPKLLAYAEKLYTCVVLLSGWHREGLE